MAYCNGKLYIHATVLKEDTLDGTSYQVIYEVDTSGSTRKEIYRSLQPMGAKITHRGYLYVASSVFFELYEDEY